MSDGLLFVLIVLGVCLLAALVAGSPSLISTIQRWRLLSMANDPARMRAYNKRQQERERLKQKRKDEKFFEKRITTVADTLRDNGKATTDIKVVAEWFKERGYSVEPPIGGSYYKISIPDVTDKELSDIILGENK